MVFILGAVNRIRTGDLVLTKDVLYLLSHNSIIYRKLLYRISPDNASVF